MSPGQCEVRRAHRTPSDIEHRGERTEPDRTSAVYRRIIGVVTMSVFAHFLLLDYVQEVIAFSSNVPPAENILGENII